MKSEPITAPVCPYCGKDSKLVDSAVVYRKSYGPIYLCAPCQAWVGCHKGSTRPLGRLSNAELRDWKKRAHAAFDPLHLDGMQRDKKYEWLAGKMGIPRAECHIGMFDVAQCQRVVEICELETK